MQFNRGMVGVLIVVLSLIASVGLGVVTNIETETVTKDVAEYVADITGAYSSGKDQSYTEYNPSSNFNGYTNQTVTDDFAVDFVESAYTNNYPLTYYSDLISVSYTPDTIESELGLTPSSESVVSMTSYVSANRQDSEGYRAIVQGPLFDSSTNRYALSLQDVISKLLLAESTTDLKQIKLTIPVTISSTTALVIGGLGYSIDISIPLYTENSFIIRSDGYAPSQSTLQGIGAENSFEYTIYYDVTTGNCEYYLNESLVSSGAPSIYTIRWEEEGTPIKYYYYVTRLSDSTQVDSGYYSTRDNITNTLNVQYIYDRHTQYIDTRYGVGIRGTGSDPETVVWSNGQQNGVTDIAFSTWNASATDKFSDSGSPYSNTGVISYYGTNATDTFTVSRSGGYTYVALNGGTPVNVGTWNQIQLTFDNINGVLTAHPIQTWDNFNNYSVSPVSVEIGEITKANLRSITWTADNSLRLEVVNTQVFFNTYGVVMVDPEITISDLWPNYSKFMVDITKVATIGDSVTIGADTYDVEGTTVTINDTVLDVTDLKLYYTKTDTGWNVTAESGKNSTTFSENSTYLKFTGSWYFISSFYNIVTKQVQERSWDPSTYNWFESHMFFWMAGIVLLLSVIGYKLGYLDGLSIIILIATELILVIIGGTT